MPHPLAGRVIRAAKRLPVLRNFVPKRPASPGKTASGNQLSVDRPQPPDWHAFETLAAQNAGRTTTKLIDDPLDRPIDVIVPVYRGYDDTLACIHSVLTSTVSHPFELIVIDDQSPEPELSQALRRLADLDLITLLHNEHNKGFVASANRGMRCHPHRDVLLLNNDTIVYGNWLDRLADHARPDHPKHRHVGSVTPLSNNATICSYPAFVQSNPTVLELDYAAVDQLTASENDGRTIEIPTGVGFCMYIPRRALDRFGCFDQETYGHGYGEENDFCMRAALADWKNLLALDVFVRHTGETSFAGNAKPAQSAGLKTLTDRYPEYLGIVHRHIAADPAADARRRLDIARLRHHIGDGPVTLCFAHTWGGGIQRFIDDKSARLKAQGRGLLVLTPPPPNGGPPGIALNAAPALNLPNLIHPKASLFDPQIQDVLHSFAIEQIEIHSLVRSSPQTVSDIPAFAASLSAPYKFYVHDYLAVCPQLDLTDNSQRYCGELGLKQCNACLRTKKHPSRRVHRGTAFGPLKHFGQTNITAWRKAYHDLLRQAANVIAPSHDTAQRINRYFPDLAITVEPHVETIAYDGPSLAVTYSGSGPIRVAIVGAIGESKGSGVILQLAQDALDRALELEFVVVGYTNRDAELQALPNVTITGKYQEADVYDLIKDQHCHLALLPAVWPETYSYTFSTMIAAGMPSIVFNLGAPAERAANAPSVTVAPLDITPQALNDLIINHSLSGRQPMITPGG